MPKRCAVATARLDGAPTAARIGIAAITIPGTTKLARLEENLGAATVELNPDDIHALEEASSKIKLEEARYPKFHEQLVGR